MEFYPRDATLSMALYLSVCVCRKSVFYRNTKWLASSSWVFFDMEASFDLLHAGL